MRFPPAPPPFTDRVTRIGTLSAEGRSTGPLDILIDVSNTAAYGMRGWVVGNKVTIAELTIAGDRMTGTTDTEKVYDRVRPQERQKIPSARAAV